MLFQRVCRFCFNKLMGATGEPAKDLTRRDLDVFFKPRSVAVIGATDKTGHVGRTVLWNLISSPFGWRSALPAV